MEKETLKYQSQNPVLQEIIDELEIEENDRCSYPHWNNWGNWLNWNNWNNWNNWFNWYT